MKAKRPPILPNPFLRTTLAFIEISLGYGSSVLHTKEFDLYDFNLYKRKNNIKERIAIGVFQTTIQLNRSMEAESYEKLKDN